jgi:methyl halide transferase
VSKDPDRFEIRYREGNIPWDHCMPDLNFTEAVDQIPIPCCRALDIGCGAGDNVIWLTQRGFDASGCDLSPTAIALAGNRATEAGVSCRFLVSDFLIDRLPADRFGLVLDRGCFHSFDSSEERNLFAERVASILEPEGLWFTIVGNADEPQRETGPPKLTATQLITTVEPFFEVIYCRAGHFGSDQTDPPKAWISLLRKRDPAR